MHFAFPPRKSSNPPPYAARSSRSPFLRRRSLQSLAIIALSALSLIFLLTRLLGSSSSSDRIPPGTPEVVLVTVLEENRSPAFNEAIKQNRLDYAARHGYATFFPNSSSYPLPTSPSSWSKVPALRHALSLYPHTPWLFHLSPHTLIANPSLPLTSHLLAPARLEALMQTDVPVVPPDSVIKTFPGLKGERIGLVMSQDGEGLSVDVFAVRGGLERGKGKGQEREGEWARFLLDVWLDPLYRNYNFQRAERHALEHVVQWHGTLLAKLALVPQRIMNSYAKPPTAAPGGHIPASKNPSGYYEDGDFIVNFEGCDRAGRDCETEMRPFLEKLERERAGGAAEEVRV